MQNLLSSYQESRSSDLAWACCQGGDRTLRTTFALICQASVQNQRIIKPHPDWPNVLGLAKRSWFWALASSEAKGLIRRDAGRIELLDLLAESLPGRRLP